MAHYDTKFDQLMNMLGSWKQTEVAGGSGIALIFVPTAYYPIPMSVQATTNTPFSEMKLIVISPFPQFG